MRRALVFGFCASTLSAATFRVTNTHGGRSGTSVSRLPKSRNQT